MPHRRRPHPLSEADAERILSRYDARRYADELPGELLDDLNDAKEIAACEPLNGQLREEKPLSPAELLVVRWASHGLGNPEIAEVTGLALGTIQAQIKRAMRKLRAKNRTHLVARALREGLID